MTLTSGDATEECGTYENLNTVALFEDQKKVSLFTVRGYGSSRRYQLATGVLGLISAALLMAVIGMSIQRACKSCPPDWKALNHSCFYFSPPGGNMREGWDGSRADCVQRGADLAIVDTLEKQTFISKILNGRHKTFNIWYGYWIGLRDKVNEQTWTWINGSLLTEGYWRDGEPNDYNLFAEDCAATYPTDDTLKSWNDAPCSHPLGWICEKEATEI
ncbi:CD209 antigen-like protein C [Alosa pseudoharengus]|uniref:CD209 antigen-like protein C n=1 Tax=Alosa pseudoharengus TaxID=34774 RepID=UPI003F8A7ED8